MESKYCHVFVYGTLKRGEPNHHWLTDSTNGEAEFVSVAHTTQEFPLVIASRYNIPYLINAPGKGKIVEGEIYKVDTTMLLNLDVLEDHPKYYKREIQNMKTTSDSLVPSWVYLLHSFKPAMLELPLLSSYSSTGDHSLPYIGRYQRDVPGPQYYTDVKQ